MVVYWELVGQTSHQLVGSSRELHPLDANLELVACGAVMKFTELMMLREQKKYIYIYIYI